MSGDTIAALQRNADVQAMFDVYAKASTVTIENTPQGYQTADGRAAFVRLPDGRSGLGLELRNGEIVHTFFETINTNGVHRFVDFNAGVYTVFGRGVETRTYRIRGSVTAHLRTYAFGLVTTQGSEQDLDFGNGGGSGSGPCSSQYESMVDAGDQLADASENMQNVYLGALIQQNLVLGTALVTTVAAPEVALVGTIGVILGNVAPYLAAQDSVNRAKSDYSSAALDVRGC